MEAEGMDSVPYVTSIGEWDLLFDCLDARLLSSPSILSAGLLERMVRRSHWYTALVILILV